jgi:hypothetical protein
MNNLTSYNEFLTEGTISSSVSTFLKAQYNNIFNNPNQNLNNLFTDFTKKVDTEKNVANLYERYIRSSQTTMQNEINSAETIDVVNKLLSDEIKYFYFSLKPIVNKLQNAEFTMEKIFERSKDKRLMKLMSYPEDQFANSIQEYINLILPEIKKSAGLDSPQTTTQAVPQQSTPQTTTEGIMYNIYKILEADAPNQATTINTAADLLSYKKSAIQWVNMSLFEILKSKFQLLNQLGASTSNSVDQLSKQMKGTNNDNAKKMILNKIMNMNKEELQNLATSIGLKTEELGQL